MSDPGPTGTKINPEQAQAQALLNAPVPRLYANGFVVAQTNSDVSLALLLNGAPTALLSMSFISAKTLIEEMSRAMKFLEESIEQKIPTMNEVAAKLSAMQSRQKAGE